MKKTTEITNKRRAVPISITDDLIRAMLLHSRDIPGCPRPNVGSVSYYAWVAVIERLQRDGLDMTRIDKLYKLRP